MTTIHYKEMGLRIRRQREKLGYTREQLAEKLEVSPKFCSDIELGVKGMSIQTLAKLSDILNLTTDYILFGNPSGDTSTEMTVLTKLLTKCPPNQQAHLVTIVHTFLEAVSQEQDIFDQNQ